MNCKNILKNKKTFLLLIVLAALVIGGFFLFQKINANTVVEEVDLLFDPEGPYALLYPRRDGNALILNLKRTTSYESISYELAYTSKVNEIKVSGNTIEEDEGRGGVIDRGVVGTIDTKERKGEYEQEILFGTCSKNVCKYDQGVENGTLTLRIKKKNKVYKMITLWHLQRPDVALGALSSGDGHLVYSTQAFREELAAVGFTIINDLSGVPKLPQGKEVLGKVYALNVPVTKDFPAGSLNLELAENPPPEAALFRFNGNNWEELETKIDGSKLFSKADGVGIFAVLIPKK